jgi:hypothetical protein
MAFASSKDVSTIYLATPLAGRKAQNMIARPGVSLLWDNRTGNTTDHGDGLLVTANGIAALATDVDDASSDVARASFLTKNPNMESFLRTEGVGLFSVKISSYEIVLGYERPQFWDPAVVAEPSDDACSE